MSVMDETYRLRTYIDACTDHEVLLASNPPKHRVTCTDVDIKLLIDAIESAYADDVISAENRGYESGCNEGAAKEHFVELPKDADGVRIHIGDEMEGVDKYDSLKKVRGKVITVSFESDGIVDVAIQVWNSDGKSWHRAYLDTNASVYRHYHEPTVEDVLREFADLVREEQVERAQISDEAIAEFAERLQLRERDDGEEC